MNYDTANLDFATIDFETYYTREYSLSKLQTDAYVLDPQFEIIGVSVRPNLASDIQWFSGTHAETKAFLQGAIDWERMPVCAHNTLFDGFIATQVLGLKPRLWMDTLGMGRSLAPWLKSHSLASLAKHFRLGEKGREVHNAINKRRADFAPAELAAYGDYCGNDTALTSNLAVLMLELGVPPLELFLIDMTVRMFTEPRIVGDVPLLEKYYADEVARKEAALQKAGISKEELMSNAKFAEALLNLGVRPPYKTSPTTGKETYAFAKTDKGFTVLLEHEDNDVQALVAARLKVKTTIAETRALRLIEAAKRGPLPVYLNHWGAKTTGRLSGGNKMNWQNVPARGPGAVLRDALRAPPGHAFVVGDSSNIELRVALACAGHTNALELLEQGADLYCDFSSDFYGRQITKADKMERQLGKVAMLSLQYGVGAARFRDMARLMAGADLSEAEAQHLVDLYRRKYSKLRNLWYHCAEHVLPCIQRGQSLEPVDVNGWFLTMGEGFSLPGSPGVCYHDLQKGADGNWSYIAGANRVKIYGAKVVENLCQHAARQIVMWQTARVHRRFPVVLSVHDEIGCVVREDQVDECRAYMHECLTLAPEWCRGAIPLGCEIGVGDSYGSAK